jgi:hypothetical protein
MERVASALGDNNLTEAQKESFLSALRENGYKFTQQANWSYLVFLGLSAAFTLIVGAQLNKVTILGIDFSKDNLVILLLPTGAAFFLYRASCLNQFSVIINKALEKYYEITYESIAREKLHLLLSFPAISDVEQALDNLANQPSILERLSLIWIVILGVVFFLTPVVWFGGMIWWLFAVSSFEIIWKILSTASIIFLSVRAIWIILQTWRYT